MFFVTTTVVDFAKVFTEERYCDILLHNIKHYQKQYDFRIYAYVIMPSHFHWVVEINPERGTISDLMRDVKKYSAWDLMDALHEDGMKDLQRLFRYKANEVPGQQRKFWMKRFDDEVIRNSGMLRTKIEYIHYNPVKSGHVLNAEEYKYSSARNYLLDDHSVLRVETNWS